MAKNKNDNFTFKEKEEMPFAKVTKKGEARKDFHPKNTWEFDITEFLEDVIPKDYFATTGEAVVKMRKLENDLFAQAGLARKLGNTLEKLKGENIYMETCWTGGRLLLKAKNPRKNREAKLEALWENFEGGKKQ
tara:strand:- start:55146 stop:55547 length:402 start_codon:yes stop_codon:yes gene_type:complete